MSLVNLLALDDKGLRKDEVTEERINEQLDNIRHLISWFRMYPDYMVDFIKGPECTFKFLFYQRINNMVPILREEYSKHS